MRRKEKGSISACQRLEPEEKEMMNPTRNPERPCSTVTRSILLWI
jgi:hypothetical protein